MDYRKMLAAISHWILSFMKLWQHPKSIPVSIREFEGKMTQLSRRLQVLTAELTQARDEAATAMKMEREKTGCREQQERRKIHEYKT